MAAVVCITTLGFAGGCASEGYGGGHEEHAGATQARSEGQGERFVAWAVNLGVTPVPPAQPRHRTGIVKIAIDRWSTPEERDQLVAALTQGGEQGLLAALQKTPSVGTIRTPDSLSWYLHYAHQVVQPDGRRHIHIATDRPVRFWEEFYQTRSAQYPFMLIELDLDKDGHGEGRLSYATKIMARPEERRIEIETYASEPVLLEDVRPDR